LAGDDVLEGNLGKDRLEGGSGADHFVFSDAAHSRVGVERDVITDFSVLEGDRIDLSQIDANPLLSGDQDFTFLGRGSANRSIGAGEVKYYHHGGNTYLVGGLDGDNQADFQIEIIGLHNLADGELAALSGVRLSEGAGQDTLLGTAGVDMLSGLGGNDTLLGLAGDDVLNGGLDRDRLEGGSGADRFVFSDAAHSRVGVERDVITDFSVLEGDRIDLSQIDANPLLSGDQDFTFLGRGSANRSIGAGEVKYYHHGGNTYLVGGLDGDNQADFQIEIIGLHNWADGQLFGIA
jgi:Ca2+-binding RTX toxin-like protein